MLTKLQVLNITETIDKAEISFSHLRDELVDHVCCEIENQMENGLDFIDAFELIKPKVGIRELQKVQEGTLLLIDKKYRIMKRLMKISGILSLIGLIIGSLSRVYHIPGANIILAFGFLILCIFFLPSSISIMRKENKANSKVLLYLFAYIGSIGFSMGIFFKLMHWPGAGILIALGIFFISLLFLPVLWLTLKKKITSKTEKTAVLFGIIGGSLHFIGVLFKIQHWPGTSIIYITSVVFIIFIFIPLYSFSKFKSDTHVNERYIYIIYALTFFILLTLLIQFQFSFDLYKVFKKDTTTKLAFLEYPDNITRESSLNTLDSVDRFQRIYILNKIQIAETILDSVYSDYIALIAPGTVIDNNNKSNLFEVIAENGNSKIFESVIFGGDGISPAARIKNNFTEIAGFVDNNKLLCGKNAIMAALLNTKVPIGLNISWEDYIFRKNKPIVQYEIILSLQQRLKLAEKELLN